MVIGTEKDGVKEWLETGVALGKFVLEVTANSLAYSFLNQPCEVVELRHPTVEMLEMRGCPQLILRVGFFQESKPLKPTHRRPLSDVVEIE